VRDAGGKRFITFFCSSESDDAEWQQKLEKAQNAIFCRELFAQLAKEAIILQAPIPHMVVGNQVSLFEKFLLRHWLPRCERKCFSRALK
jgi:hypothetical protein